uniref:Uncharacterized protein n=1 Tax=viral metagenome TaxID=1070528 RepID=A0A6M3LHT2_9ZZZZ
MKDKQWHKDYNRQYYQAHKIEIIENSKKRLIEHPIINVWMGMKRRCYNPSRKDYKRYGGRGIIVCQEWLDYKTFEKWALANGYRKGLTIDRIDNDGDYEPSNCRFITRAENNLKRWKKGGGK